MQERKDCPDLCAFEFEVLTLLLCLSCPCYLLARLTVQPILAPKCSVQFSLHISSVVKIRLDRGDALSRRD